MFMLGQKALLPGELILMGRGSHCELFVDDPSASRVHCRVLVRDGKVFLTDAGSRWGTYVNGVSVTECELIPGDEVTIGESVLRLVAEPDAHDTTLARRSEIVRPTGLAIEGVRLSHDEREDQGIGSVKPPRNVPNAPVVTQHVRPGDFLGHVFAGSRIDSLVCRARTGLVYRGQRQGQIVVVKILYPALLQQEGARERFLRAVAATRGLKHPNLVELLDGGVVDEIPYVVSEFIDGESADEMIRRIGVAGMLDWRATLRIAIEMASALEFLERHGVLHRNVTPRHVITRHADRGACLSDLLIAKAIDDPQPALTQAGEIVGELAYMSPEQLGSGQPIDHRSDIYQLGSTLYALLTGRPPFEGANVAEVIPQVLRETPVPPTRHHLAIPPLLEGAIGTMLSKRPQDRFGSARDLLRALKRAEEYSG